MVGLVYYLLEALIERNLCAVGPHALVFLFELDNLDLLVV
jgi:hypothetical protein